MPLYEYICSACGKSCELLVSTSRTRPSCPQCGSSRLKRQLSTFAAHSGPSRPSGCPAAATCPTDSCPGGSCPLA